MCHKKRTAGDHNKIKWKRNLRIKIRASVVKTYCNTNKVATSHINIILCERRSIKEINFAPTFSMFAFQS